MIVAIKGVTLVIMQDDAAFQVLSERGDYNFEDGWHVVKEEQGQRPVAIELNMKTFDSKIYRTDGSMI